MNSETRARNYGRKSQCNVDFLANVRDNPGQTDRQTAEKEGCRGRGRLRGITEEFPIDGQTLFSQAPHLIFQFIHKQQTKVR